MPLPPMLNTIPNCHEASATMMTSGQPSEAQLAAIAAAGYEVVINLGLHGLWRVLEEGWPRETAFDILRSVANERWAPDATWQRFIDMQLEGAAPVVPQRAASVDAMADYYAQRAATRDEAAAALGPRATHVQWWALRHYWTPSYTLS